jgi:hypothetical protein
MALTDLSFERTGNRWLSEEYEPSTSNMSVGVKFWDRPGAAVVERSIDGENWVTAGAIASAGNDARYVLLNVCGFVAGERFRVTATELPERIHILEG